MVVSRVLSADTTVRVTEIQLDIVKQRVVDFDEAAKKVAELVVQLYTEPPDRIVLPLIGV